jgi:hypothetical protein
MPPSPLARGDSCPETLAGARCLINGLDEMSRGSLVGKLATAAATAIVTSDADPGHESVAGGGYE